MEKNMKKNAYRTSLVVQWIGLCQPVQGTWVPSLVQEDSTHHETAKPMRHNYRSLHAWSLCPPQEKPLQREALTPQQKVAPARCNWRKPMQSDGDPAQPVIEALSFHCNRWGPIPGQGTKTPHVSTESDYATTNNPTCRREDLVCHN